MYIISSIVVQGRWYTYGYVVPQFFECYMRYELQMTGADHPTDHYMTSSYAPDMLSCHPGFQNLDLDLCASWMVEWYKHDDTGIDMLSYCYMGVVRDMNHVWYGWMTHRPQYVLQLHSRHAQLLPRFLSNPCSALCAWHCIVPFVKDWFLSLILMCFVK